MIVQSLSCNRQSFTIPTLFNCRSLCLVGFWSTMCWQSLCTKTRNWMANWDFFEIEAELEHLLVNETSQSREKTDIVQGLRSLCPGKHRVLSKPASGCVQTWLYCKICDIDLTEPQCDSHSLVCLPSITRSGFPKCKPVYRLKQILHNDQRKIVHWNWTLVVSVHDWLITLTFFAAS